MAQMSRGTRKVKSTTKLAPKSIGIISDIEIEFGKDKIAQALGVELARSGHIACFANANSFCRMVAKNVVTNGGTTIHYAPIIEEAKTDNTSSETGLMHQVETHLDYENTLMMMIRSIDGIILAPNESKSLKILTFPMPPHLLIGILTDEADLSAQLLNIMQTAGTTDQILTIDSSPSQLIKRMAKQLRQKQLRYL